METDTQELIKQTVKTASEMLQKIQKLQEDEKNNINQPALPEVPKDVKELKKVIDEKKQCVEEARSNIKLKKRQVVALRRNFKPTDIMTFFNLNGEIRALTEQCSTMVNDINYLENHLPSKKKDGDCLYCEDCMYKTSTKRAWLKHISTLKHNKKTHG